MNRDFPAFTETDAPEDARAALTRACQAFGSLPSPLARLALAPKVLTFALQSLGTFDQTSLTPLEREVVAMTVARRNECHYCLALHTRILLRAQDGVAKPLASALANGATLEDARLEALRRFTEAVLSRTGDVDESSWQAFLDAGFSRAQALEVVLGVGVYTLTTFLNRLIQAPIDAAVGG